MSALREAPIHSLLEAFSQLKATSGAEELATLTGDGVLVVDLHREACAMLSADAQTLLPKLLGQLACPTVALLPKLPSRELQVLAQGFDLWVEEMEDLPQIIESIRQSPLASLALVQVLRHNSDCNLHQGLIAESWVYSTLQSGPEFACWLKDRPSRLVQPPEKPVLRVERRGNELMLTLDRPERHNAFGTHLRDALAEAFRLAATDISITRVRLRAEGPSFCSGGDLDEFGDAPDPATAHAIRSTRHPARLLADLPQPSSAELQGACIGAGIELPAFTSEVIAREDAYFALPEVTMGLVPGAGGTVSLPRRIGRQRTAWMAITGKRIDAQTAHRWGLVDRIVAS